MLHVLMHNEQIDDKTVLLMRLIRYMRFPKVSIEIRDDHQALFITGVSYGWLNWYFNQRVDVA